MRCIIDGHCDTLSKALDTNTNLNNSKFCFNLDIVKDNVPYIQLMAAYVDPEYVRGNMEKGGFYRAINILNKFEEEKNNENIINDKNLTINIDFENVKSKNGTDFIQFIRELGIMCRNNGIILSIDNYPPANYSAYYAREEQAAVADYVITMAYDEYYSGSEEAGPVSSLSYVKNAVTNILNEVPAKQSVIGLPFYSRMWKETTRSGETKIKSEACSMKYAEELVNDAKADRQMTGLYIKSGLKMPSRLN